MSDTRPSAEIVKGSWEDLLLQARTLAYQDNDDAIPIFQRLVDRLSGLPVGQRTAADGRLNRLLVSAAFQYTEYLNACGRYDDALALIAQVEPVLPEQERPPWNRFAASIQLMAGNVDEGLANLRRVLTAVPEEAAVSAWSGFAIVALENGDFAATQSAVAQAESWNNRLWGHQQTAPGARNDAARVSFAKARFAVAQGQNAEALAWYEHAMMLSEEFGENPQFMYPVLIDAGAHSEALALIRRDQENAVRSGFWQGLIQRRLGNTREAERQWRKVLQLELADDEEVDLLEWTMTHYYLGDRDGAALAGVLESLRQGSLHAPGLFYLAAVGWALRGDRVTAVADLRQARKRHRALAEGAALPRRWWRLMAELTDESMHAALSDFFEPARAAR